MKLNWKKSSVTLANRVTKPTTKNAPRSGQAKRAYGTRIFGVRK
jgi:hypothetical protein